MMLGTAEICRFDAGAYESVWEEHCPPIRAIGAKFDCQDTQLCLVRLTLQPKSKRLPMIC